jgi:hypothetical protein
VGGPSPKEASKRDCGGLCAAALEGANSVGAAGENAGQPASQLRTALQSALPESQSQEVQWPSEPAAITAAAAASVGARRSAMAINATAILCRRPMPSIRRRLGPLGQAYVKRAPQQGTTEVVLRPLPPLRDTVSPTSPVSPMRPMRRHAGLVDRSRSLPAGRFAAHAHIRADTAMGVPGRMALALRAAFAACLGA